jgi:DNA polymerase-1
MSYAVVDVETTTKLSFKRKANAFDADNWVVYVGTKYAGEALSSAVHFKNREDNAGWLVKVLRDGIKIIVGHNPKFDILHAIAKDDANLSAWMRFIADGGIIWDTQTAEYLLGGMLPELHMLSLDEVAPLYGGEVKPSEVKALWEAGVDTPDIPEDLMLNYLIGNGIGGDIGNTEKVFLGQMKRAREAGQIKSLLLNMGAYAYTIEAERNGMFIDKELGLTLAAELKTELDALTLRLDEYIPPLPKDCEFKWGSRHHKSALIFGGNVKYETKEDILDEQMQFVYYQKKETHYVRKDKTTTPDINDPNIEFYAGGKNAGSPKTKQVTVPDIERGPKQRNVEKLFALPGFTKPNKEWESKTEGVYSTAAEVIELLGNRNIPFLKDLSRHAKLEKDLGTYFIKTDEDGKQTGMLTLVQPDSIIHHQINHNSTVTARFSSSNPNLQNIPKSGEGKSRVKEIFKSRFPGGSVIQSDFTALEIYIQAILTGDKQLIADLIDGLDMHCSRVATTHGIAYAEVVRLVKEVEDKLWIERRKGAKEFSFQRAYGAGAQKISDSTGLDIDTVKALIVAEQQRYPDIEPYYERVTAAITGNKRNVRKHIPHPDFPSKMVELRTGYFRTPDNKLYTYLEQAAPKFVVERQGVWTSFSPTEIKNYVVQGSGAEWAKAACWLAVRLFYRLDNLGGKALLVNQVHDACYADAAAEVRDQAAAMLHAAMESASDFMENYFGWKLPVKVPSETTAGPSMADEGKLPNVRSEAMQYKEYIRQNFFL